MNETSKEYKFDDQEQKTRERALNELEIDCFLV